MTSMRDLTETYARLRPVLARLGLPHAFIGAMAVQAWGRPRATSDLDMVFSCRPEDWESVITAFHDAGLELRSVAGPADASDRIPDIGFFWSSDPQSVRVDVFLAKTPFESAVIATAREANVLGASMKVASPEASIIYKLLASRGKDLPDVDTVFETRAAAGDRLDWTFLEHWAHEWGIEDRLVPYRARYGPPA